MTLKELLEERAGIYEKIKDIDSRSDEDGNLSAEDQEQYEKLSERYHKLTKEKERAEEQQAKRDKRQEEMTRMKADMDERRGPVAALDIDEDDPSDLPAPMRDNPRSGEEYRDAFWRTMRTPKDHYPDPEDVRALKVGDDVKGGYLAPAEFEQQVIAKLREENVMRPLCDVMTSSSDRRIPVERDLPTFAYIPEEGTYPETDMEFGLVAIGAWKNGGIVKVSEELLQDAYFDLPGYLRNQMGEAAAEVEEKAFITGTGVNEPEGIIEGGQKGVDAAAAEDVEADEIIELYHSLHRRYRDRAYWLFDDATALKIRKLKDGDGRYLWVQSFQAGEPDRILGRPVVISEHVPDMESDAEAIIFGALRYYRIMDRTGLAVQRLDEKYANTGQIGFKAYIRSDGRLLRPDAVKYMEMA